MPLVARYGTTRHAVTAIGPRWRLANSCARTFHAASVHHTRSLRDLYSTTSESEPEPNPKAKRVAVIGGGITGLSAAFNASKRIPAAKITLYESSQRLGGWIDSETVEVDGGEVLFEWGPRSLRPDLNGQGPPTVQLLGQLGMQQDIIGIPLDHPAALNRYIYYPDHLVRMPAPYARTGPFTNFFLNIRTILAEPIFRGLFKGLLAEPSVKIRASHIDDESVGDFVRRRFGPTIADNMLSAIFHGIYAGDIYKLSARTLLPKLWYLETRDPEGSGVLPELFETTIKQQTLTKLRDSRLNLGRLLDPRDEETSVLQLALADQSVYTFVKGLGQLTERLVDKLDSNANVTLKLNSKVTSLKQNTEADKISVNGTDYDYVISTLSPSTLAKAAAKADSTDDPMIRIARSVSDTATVMVVNLYFSDPDLLSSHPGFGYLIPQSIPVEQNPERALGVIFASETSGRRPPDAMPDKQKTKSSKSPEVDTDTSQNTGPIPEVKHEGMSPDIIQEHGILMNLRASLRDDLKRRYWAHNAQDTVPGTKLTVMFGGHWWDGWEPADYPSEAQAIAMAKSVLARHLKISEEPAVAKARLQRDAIPQYRVGYRKVMAQMHQELLSKFQGKLKVAGPAWQGGVGINDCVRKAWEVVSDVRDSVQGTTGLEEYGVEDRWVLFDQRSGKLVDDKQRDALDSTS